jgi:hypothetical protein
VNSDKGEIGMARRRDSSALAGSVRAWSIVLFVGGMMAAPAHGRTQESAAPPAPAAPAAPPAAPCVPAGAQPDANYQMNVGDMPAVLRAGDTLTLQIDKCVKAEEIQAYCFDGQPVMSPRLETGAVTTLTVTVPGDPKTPVLPPAAHTLTVVLKSGKVIETPLIAPVRLIGLAIDLANASEATARVTLFGHGFDASRPGDHVVQLQRGGVEYDTNICWSDADCAQKKSQVRGAFRDGMGDLPDRLIIEKLDPALVRMSTFSVCRLGVCSNQFRDPKAETLYWVPGVAYAFALIVAGIVVFLASRLRPLNIDNSKYLITALFIDKETNTYSLSKLQFYMWTFVAVFGYIQLLIARWWIQGQAGLPPLPSGLPGIVGLAAGTSVGSQLVTGMNGPKGAGQLKPSIADFVTSGEAVAADRVQFLVWTIVGTVGYLVVLTSIDPRVLVELPEVPFSILSISGISALGYLGGKFARQPGPVINEITTTTTDRDPAAPPLAAPQQPPAPQPPAPQPSAPQPQQPAPPAATAKFGLLEIRGRALSPDATFRVSVGADPSQGEVPITFDRLEPLPAPSAPSGDTAPKPIAAKPRVIEADDTKSGNYAKRLLLVVRPETPELKRIFTPNSKHVLTIANPDSQKAMLTFSVPDTVRPV